MFSVWFILANIVCLFILGQIWGSLYQLSSSQRYGIVKKHPKVETWMLVVAPILVGLAGVGTMILGVGIYLSCIVWLAELLSAHSTSPFKKTWNKVFQREWPRLTSLFFGWRITLVTKGEDNVGD
jgi:hypothetical protein